MPRYVRSIVPSISKLTKLILNILNLAANNTRSCPDPHALYQLPLNHFKFDCETRVLSTVRCTWQCCHPAKMSKDRCFKLRHSTDRAVNHGQATQQHELSDLGRLSASTRISSKFATSFHLTCDKGIN